MKYANIIPFLLLAIAGNRCSAQTTSISANVIMVGYDKHTTLLLSKEDSKTLDFIKANNCEIISYKLSKTAAGQKTYLEIKGDSLPSATMSNLKSGDKISIENIQAKCGKEAVKSIKGATIKVK